MSEKKETREERNKILSDVFGEEVVTITPEQLAQEQKDAAYVQLLMCRDLPQFAQLAQNFINYFDLKMKVEDINTKDCPYPTFQQQEDDYADNPEYYAIAPIDDVALTTEKASEISLAEKRARYFESTQDIEQENKPKYLH